jgi:hypothetical protein
VRHRLLPFPPFAYGSLVSPSYPLGVLAGNAPASQPLRGSTPKTLSASPKFWHSALPAVRTNSLSEDCRGHNHDQGGSRSRAGPEQARVETQICVDHFDTGIPISNIDTPLLLASGRGTLSPGEGTARRRRQVSGVFAGGAFFCLDVQGPPATVRTRQRRNGASGGPAKHKAPGSCGNCLGLRCCAVRYISTSWLHRQQRARAQ